MQVGLGSLEFETNICAVMLYLLLLNYKIIVAEFKTIIMICKPSVLYVQTKRFY